MSLLKSLFELPPQAAPVQQAYRKEIVTEATLPMCFALMEGGFAGVIADKVFAASPLVIAVIAAAPVIYLVSNQLGANYTTSIFITLVIPFAVSLVTLPFWANFLDQNHVTMFRARQSALWVMSQLVIFAGAILGSLWILGVGRLLPGVARGGGSLAWTLGHNDFARPTELGAYMGAHVTLTGIRGAFAPFVGILLYLGWEANWLLPGFEGLGAGVFLVAAALSGMSWVGYRRMKRVLTEEQKLETPK